MNKYNFKDLKKYPLSKPLPEDCNKDALDIADKFKDEELKKDIKEAQTNKWYGTLNHYDSNGVLRAYFEFCAGICIRMRLVKSMSKNNEFHMNVINKNVSLKSGEHENV
jgi:integrase